MSSDAVILKDSFAFFDEHSKGDGFEREEVEGSALDEILKDSPNLLPNEVRLIRTLFRRTPLSLQGGTFSISDDKTQEVLSDKFGTALEQDFPVVVSMLLNTWGRVSFGLSDLVTGKQHFGARILRGNSFEQVINGQSNCLEWAVGLAILSKLQDPSRKIEIIPYTIESLYVPQYPIEGIRDHFSIIYTEGTERHAVVYPGFHIPISLLPDRSQPEGTPGHEATLVLRNYRRAKDKLDQYLSEDQDNDQAYRDSFHGEVELDKWIKAQHAELALLEGAIQTEDLSTLGRQIRLKRLAEQYDLQKNIEKVKHDIVIATRALEFSRVTNVDQKRVLHLQEQSRIHQQLVHANEEFAVQQKAIMALPIAIHLSKQYQSSRESDASEVMVNFGLYNWMIGSMASILRTDKSNQRQVRKNSQLETLERSDLELWYLLGNFTREYVSFLQYETRTTLEELFPILKKKQQGTAEEQDI